MMTISDDQDRPDDVLPYDEEEDEGDSSSSSGEGKGGSGRHPAGAKPQESLFHKIADLILHPFSHLVPGASAMASENELSQRIFMGKIGLENNEITREDLADPHLIKRLDARQNERRERFGIPHPDLNFQILPAEGDDGGAAGSSAAMAIDSSLLGGSGEKPSESQDKSKRGEDKNAVREDGAEDDLPLGDGEEWAGEIVLPSLPSRAAAGDLSNLFDTVVHQTVQGGFQIRLEQGLDFGERHDAAPSPRGVS
jgi:hypothetical protein